MEKQHTHKPLNSWTQTKSLLEYVSTILNYPEVFQIIKFSTKVHFVIIYFNHCLTPTRHRNRQCGVLEVKRRHPQTSSPGRRGTLAIEETLRPSGKEEGKIESSPISLQKWQSPAPYLAEVGMQWCGISVLELGIQTDTPPQEGNMEAMRHDTIKRVTFYRWENKFSKLDTPPHPQRKGNQRWNIMGKRWGVSTWIPPGGRQPAGYQSKWMTLACGLFWAEGNQDPTDSRKTFTSP